MALQVHGAGTYVPDASWSGVNHLFDMTAGAVNIDLPSAASLGPNWHLPLIYKTDPASGKVRFKVTATGDKLNTHWDKNHPYGLVLNLTQQAAELYCDGESNFFLCGKPFHKFGPQSQRTPIGITNYTVTPDDIGELIVCDTRQSPDGYIFLHLPAISTFCPVVTTPTFTGHYPSYQISVQKNDPGPGYVVVGTQLGEKIEPNNDHILNPSLDRGYLYLTKQWDTVTINIKADGFFVQSFFRASMLPQGYGQ